MPGPHQPAAYCRINRSVPCSYASADELAPLLYALTAEQSESTAPRRPHLAVGTGVSSPACADITVHGICASAIIEAGARLAVVNVNLQGTGSAK